MARSATFLDLYIVTCLLDLALSDCGVPVLREGAADLVKASFKKGFSRTDFTKIELQAFPFLLVEDGACINLDRIGLQYNNDGGNDWRDVDFKTTLMFGGEYKFTIEHITPCKDHYFKLLISSEGEFLELVDHRS